MPVETRPPWVEHGHACVQVVVRQPNGSTVEPIARVPLAALRTKRVTTNGGGQDIPLTADEAHAVLQASVDAEVARYAPPDQKMRAKTVVPTDPAEQFLASWVPS